MIVPIRALYSYLTRSMCHARADDAVQRAVLRRVPDLRSLQTKHAIFKVTDVRQTQRKEVAVVVKGPFSDSPAFIVYTDYKSGPVARAVLEGSGYGKGTMVQKDKDTICCTLPLQRELVVCFEVPGDDVRTIRMHVDLGPMYEMGKLLRPARRELVHVLRLRRGCSHG